MATAVPEKNAAPYANRLDETHLDAISAANGGNVNVRVTIDLNGTVAQVQADWATLIAATFTAVSARITHSAA